MKKVIFLGLVITLIIGRCAQEKKSPIEGTWQMVYAKYSINYTFPAQIQGSQIKMWTKGYFAFLGRFKMDTLMQKNYGGGPFKIDGNRCEIIRQYHYVDSLVGTTLRVLIEVRNDTLIQKWPVDENWNLKEKYQFEKYVRLE